MLYANTNLNYVLNFFDLTKEELSQEMGEDDCYNYGFGAFELTRWLGSKEFSAFTVNGQDWGWTVRSTVCFGSEYCVDDFHRRTRLHLRQALRVLGKSKREIDSAITYEIARDYPKWLYGVCPVFLSWKIADGIRMELSAEPKYVNGSNENAIRYKFTLVEDAEGEGPTLPYPEDEIPF